MLEQRQLGRDGPMVPVIGLGGVHAGGHFGVLLEQRIADTVHFALDHGITLIDTAEGYGTSEAIIGRALKGRDRDSYFLATKASRDFSRQGILGAMDNSLRQLQVDYVDLYQMHGYSTKCPIEETMSTIEELRQQGKTRYLGVSNYNVEQMQAALKITRIHSLQPRYNILDREIEAETIPFCEQEGIGILVYSPLAQGVLGGKYKPGHKFADDDVRRKQDRTFREIDELTPKLEALRGIAERRGKSFVQLVMNSLLRQDAVTCLLVSCRTNEQALENVGAQGWRLTDEDWKEIERILGE